MHKDATEFMIDKNQHRINLQKSKSYCWGLVKEKIESITNMLKDGLFRDEQHVRFSLTGGLCFELGWGYLAYLSLSISNK
jgi:hypothetical protein